MNIPGVCFHPSVERNVHNIANISINNINNVKHEADDDGSCTAGGDKITIFRCFPTPFRRYVSQNDDNYMRFFNINLNLDYRPYAHFQHRRKGRSPTDSMFFCRSTDRCLEA